MRGEESFCLSQPTSIITDPVSERSHPATTTLRSLLNRNSPEDYAMKGSVVFGLLVLLCLHSWVHAEVPAPGVLVFCDDPTVITAVGSALDKFNKRIVVGYKMALYQILSASKSKDDKGSIYAVHFSGRKSDCPAGGDKPWSMCGYHVEGPKKAIPCNATVYVTAAASETKQVDCQLADPVRPDFVPCLGCPEKISQHSDDLTVPLKVSISRFNAMSNALHLYTLHSVGYATRQVVAGFRYRLRFDMRRSNCSKSEHKDIHKLCSPDEDNVELMNCNSTVDVAPWRHEDPEVHVQCAAGPLPPVEFTRRRPPGWSPLRNVIRFEDVPPSPTNLSTTLPETKESSEEEGMSSGTIVATTTTTLADPFHCPSKPWKEFTAVQPSQEAGPPSDTREGALSGI